LGKGQGQGGISRIAIRNVDCRGRLHGFRRWQAHSSSVRTLAAPARRQFAAL